MAGAICATGDQRRLESRALVTLCGDAAAMRRSGGISGTTPVKTVNRRFQLTHSFSVVVATMTHFLANIEGMDEAGVTTGQVVANQPIGPRGVI